MISEKKPRKRKPKRERVSLWVPADIHKMLRIIGIHCSESTDETVRRICLGVIAREYQKVRKELHATDPTDEG